MADGDDDVSRRDLGALLGVLGGAAGLAALSRRLPEGATTNDAMAPAPKVAAPGSGAVTPAQTILVETVLGPGPITCPPARSSARGGDLSSSSPACLGSNQAVIALARGCTTPGDGGGGLFLWDGASTRQDDGGTVIHPSHPSCSGAGRWIRVFEPGWVSVRWFGARGDATAGAADDSAAIMNALRCFGGPQSPPSTTTPCTLYFPEGIYLTTGISLDGYNGVRLVGAGVTLPGEHRGGTVLRATGAAPYVLQLSGSGHVVRDLVLDGANVVTQAVLLLDHSTTQNVSIRDSIVTRAKPDTAEIGQPSTGTPLVRIGNPSEALDIVHVTFENVWLAQDQLPGVCSTNSTYPFPRAKACVEIHNHNAELISFVNCQMYYATDIIVFYKGASASLTLCELEAAYASYIRIDGWATNVVVDTCWSEGIPHCWAGIWLHQTNVSAQDYNYSITLRNNTIATTLSRTHDCIHYTPNQPLIMEGNHLSGHVRISGTGSNWGLHRVYAFANVFLYGGFVDGATPGAAQLQQIGTTFLDGRPTAPRHESDLARTVVTLSTGGTVPGASGVYLASVPATLTLPDATVTGMRGRSYTLKNTSSGAVVLVPRVPTQTIDGAPSYSLSAKNKYVTVVSDGSTWQVVANN